MGNVQTSMLSAPVLGQEGMWVEAANNDSITRYNAGSTVIKYGRVVVPDTANGDHAMKLPASSGDVGKALGITVVCSACEFNADATDTALTVIKAKSEAEVGRRGVIWMLAEDAVAIGGGVFVRHTGGTGTQAAGRVRSDADTANATQLTGAVFRTATTGTDGLVAVEINLP